MWIVIAGVMAAKGGVTWLLVGATLAVAAHVLQERDWSLRRIGEWLRDR